VLPALINMTLSCAWQKFWGVLCTRADDTHANWNFRKVRRVIFVRATCDIWICVFPDEKFLLRFRRFSLFTETLNKSSLSSALVSTASSSHRCDALKWKTEREQTFYLLMEDKSHGVWIFTLAYFYIF